MVGKAKLNFIVTIAVVVVVVVIWAAVWRSSNSRPELMPQLAGCYVADDPRGLQRIIVKPSGVLEYGTQSTTVVPYEDKQGVSLLPKDKVVLDQAKSVTIVKENPLLLRFGDGNRSFTVLSEGGDTMLFQKKRADSRKTKLWGCLSNGCGCRLADPIADLPPLVMIERGGHGGPWDYKQGAKGLADYGNYNYGYTGYAAGFPLGVLLRQAGRAQEAAGTSQSGWSDPGLLGLVGGTAPYGDDPRDQAMIKRGYQDRANGC